MVLLVKCVVPKCPKLMEYSLGIAMIVGMACAVSSTRWRESKREARKMENKTMENWKRSCVRIGAPTNLLAAATSFIPVLWLCSTYDCWPALDVVLMAWSMVALSFGAFYFVEPISYYAALGMSGTYLSFLSGNIGNMRVPVAAMALESTDSQPGTLQAEVASTMAICGSIITNLSSRRWRRW